MTRTLNHLPRSHRLLVGLVALATVGLVGGTAAAAMTDDADTINAETEALPATIREGFAAGDALVEDRAAGLACVRAAVGRSVATGCAQADATEQNLGLMMAGIDPASEGGKAAAAGAA